MKSRVFYTGLYEIGKKGNAVFQKQRHFCPEPVPGITA